MSERTETRAALEKLLVQLVEDHNFTDLKAESIMRLSETFMRETINDELRAELRSIHETLIDHSRHIASIEEIEHNRPAPSEPLEGLGGIPMPNGRAVHPHDHTCNEDLKQIGYTYPRTCKKCGLGRCHYQGPAGRDDFTMEQGLSRIRQPYSEAERARDEAQSALAIALFQANENKPLGEGCPLPSNVLTKLRDRGWNITRAK